MSDLDKNQSILDDVSSSFKSLITERFTSPFLFSFVISWLIFNHKLLIISFSNATDRFPIAEKFKLFDSILNSSYLEIPFTDKTLLLDGFVFPLISAIFYTFVYPFADYYITKFTLERKVNIRNLRVQKEHDIYYTIDDVHKVYSKHFEDEKRWKSRLDQAEVDSAYKDSLIKELQSKIDLFNEQTQSNFSETEKSNTRLALAHDFIAVGDLNSALKELSEVIVSGSESQKNQAEILMKKLKANNPQMRSDSYKNTTDPMLTGNEIALINLLGKAANSMVDWVGEKDVMKSSRLTPVETKIAIDDLYNKNLIKREYRSKLNDFGLQLTVDGLKQYKKPLTENA